MTALPWDVAPEPMREDVEAYTLVVDANGEVTADCGILGRSDEENEAHARMIVEAVNGLREAAKGACGLFHVPLANAREIMPDLPWDEAPVREGVEYIADVKVHMLMPGQWPCIPNWHQDFVPRDPETLEERPDLLGPDNPPMLLWLSGPPLTEFKDEGISAVPARTWVEFTQFDEHRGVAATEHGWRTFIRLTPVEVMREGLPHEVIPAPPEKWIRRHTQVYLDAENFKW